MSKIITHLYDTYPQAERAVIALKNAGFPENDISIVAHEADEAPARRCARTA
jgi:hypothetical protein